MNITQGERNIIKSKLQDDIVKLSLENPCLMLNCSTGFGKAYTVIKCINKSISKRKWLILVPEIQQIDNFKAEFIKFGYEELLNTKIEDIICYASLKNYENTTLNIVANECQHISPQRHEILKTIKFSQFIADSATIPENIQYQLGELGDFYNYSLPLKEGIDLGIFHKPKIYPIYVDINDIKETFEYTKFKKVYKNVSASNYYIYLSNQVKYWREQFNARGEKYMENQSLQFATKRKRFMASIKTIVVKQYIKKFKVENRRFLIFAGSIAQTEELMPKNVCLHSKKSAKVNKTIIDKFNNLEINELCTCNMLTEGMNLNELDTVMCVQLDSGAMNDSLKILQQLGRIRKKDPELYIILLKNSQDEKYYQNAIKAIGEEFIVKN
jgi:superfamily II DNA or RNA helicase